MNPTNIALAVLATSALMVPCRAQEAPDKPKRTPEEAFAKLDKNSDGAVSKEEFMASKKAQKDPEKAAKKFGKMDTDTNGSLSLDEFKAGAAKKSEGAGKAGEGEASNE